MREKNEWKKNDVAILLLAGKGERLLSALKDKKQFLDFDGKALFLHPLTSLVLSRCFSKIVLVLAKEDEERVRRCLRQDAFLQKEKFKFVYGGQTRNESVRNALNSLDKKKGNFFVLIHDAARPFLTEKQVEAIMSKTYRADALTYCIPLSDSLFRQDGKGIEYLDRKNLYLVQTPQVFDYRKLLSLYRTGDVEDTTDDFSKAVRAGMKTLPLPGDLSLFKVTGEDDLSLLRMLSVLPS